MDQTHRIPAAHIRQKDKAVQSIEQHLYGTAKKARKFAEKIGMPKSGYILGLLHDIGKYSDDFQKRIYENGEICDHSTAAAVFLNRFYRQAAQNNMQIKIVLKALMLASLGHHGGLMDVYTFEKDNLSERLAKEQLFEHIEHRAQPILREAGKLLNSDKFRNECGAVVKSILNNVKNYPNSDGEPAYFELSLLVKFLYSCLVDSDRLNTIEFELGKAETFVTGKWNKIEKALDNKVSSLPKTKLSSIRNEIYRACGEKGDSPKGIYALKVQTGGGKTLASFKFAVTHAKKNKMRRIIYVLPFISIIEQNAEVIRKLLFQHGIAPEILEESHSSAIIVEQDDYDENEKPKKYRVQSNWNSQIVFTTMVGFLESVYGPGTQRIRRFHNLADSVIVFDEIQALPANCTCLFNLLIRFLTEECGASVVLCSATQPLLHKIGDQIGTDIPHRYTKFQLKPPFPISDKVYPELERTRIIFEKGQFSYSEIAEKIMWELDDVGNVLAVVNTKRSADTLYRLLHKRGVKVFYLSTNLCAEHRSNVIEQIHQAISVKVKFVCVSTPLIEAGVDLDFDCAFRFLAGIDSIIQTAGRCNREGKLIDKNGNPLKGKVFVLDCSEEKLGGLKEIIEFQKSALESFYEKDFIDDSSADNYYLRKYFNVANKTDNLKYPVKLDFASTNIVELLSTNIKAVKNFKHEVWQSFKSAAENFAVIEKNQISVLVPYGEAEKIVGDIAKYSINEIVKNYPRFFVNIYESGLKKFAGALGEKDGMLYIKKGFYDEITGLSQSPVSSESDAALSC